MKYRKPSEDLSQVRFGDKRLDKRLEKTVESMTGSSQTSILGRCGCRSDAKAFYALLSNEKFSHKQIIEAAGNATIERIKSSGITSVLLPQDTTDINLNGHKKTEGLGYSSNHTKGIQVHSCLALTPEGVSLGLLSQQYGTRKESKSGLAAEKKKRRPIEEKESYRWLEGVRESLRQMPDDVMPIIICDREGDFYELYAEMLSLGAMFVVRIVQNRTTDEGERSIHQIRRTKACGEVEISVPRDTRKNTPPRTAKMEVAYREVTIVKHRRISTKVPEQLTLNLIRITEIGDTKEPIEWILATNMSLASVDDAMNSVDYYVHRWKIERFHYILKSGCQVEKIGQRTYDRILPVILIYSVIAAFILAMTYFARATPNAPCDTFLQDDEWKLLYRLVTRKANPPSEPYSIKTAVAYLGELGSFRHSLSDGDYGVKAIWKGLFKLFDAFDIVNRLMGQV